MSFRFRGLAPPSNTMFLGLPEVFTASRMLIRSDAAKYLPDAVCAKIMNE